MLMAFVLLAGCAGTKEPAQTGAVTVSNVDELLAAIAPGAQIVMEPGTYTLSGASDYGTELSGGYYSWEDKGDGYQLVLKGIRGLTIRGSGAGVTILETEPQYANVLVLQSCADVVLEDLSVGRTNEDERGGGVDLLDCTNVDMKGLRLFGCGTVGLQLENGTDISIADSEIYACSFIGIQAEQTTGLTVENCTFHDLGDIQNGGSIVLRFSNSSDVTVTGCNILDNTLTNLIYCYPCDNVVIQNNSFARNQVLGPALNVDGGLVFDNNVMENNNIQSWLSDERSTVLDAIGKSWNAEMLEWYYSPPVESQPAGEQTEVHVSTVDELLAAIAPDTEIVLDAEFYDLSTATAYGTGYNDYYYWSEEFDGPSLVITDVSNLTIRSAGGDVKGCTISAVPRYAHVLSFRRCSSITLSGFTAGHTVEPGYCMGGVLFFRDCDNVLAENCGLYGCGILGVQAELSGGITVKDCDIYECSYGGIQMSEVAGVVIDGCTFRDLGGDSMTFYDCKDVTVDGQAVAGNARIA